MSAVVSVLLIVVLSYFIIRIAAVALTITGLAEDVAIFQATSAFTGVGFTTNESEMIVDHPVRRRIALTLMWIGNIGIVTGISSLMLAFLGASGRAQAERLFVLLLGLASLWVIPHSQRLERTISNAIEQALAHWTDLDIRDYAALLRLSGEYEIIELFVEEGDWVAHKTLAELELNEEGIQVLGIVRPDGTYVGAPTGRTRVLPGDTLILYGRASLLAELDKRIEGASGDRAHEAACVEQQRILSEQAQTDHYSDYREEAA